MKTLIKNLLRSIDANVTRFPKPLDLSQDNEADPIAASYLGVARPVLLKIPLKHCLTFGLTAFVPTEKGASPFVHTLKQYQTSKLNCYEGSLLEAFYTKYQPKTAGELFDLDGQCNNVLNELPPSGASLPWQPYHPSELVKVRRSQIYKDNIEHGAKLDADHGDPFYGPVSTLKGKLEFTRLIRTFESIRERGFLVDQKGTNNIRVVSLYNGNQWRAMVSGSGQHRLAALAVLGFKTAIVQIEYTQGLARSILRREDCLHWPLVQKGLMTEAEAHKTFDRMFYGRQPACASNWLDYLQASF